MPVHAARIEALRNTIWNAVTMKEVMTTMRFDEMLVARQVDIEMAGIARRFPGTDHLINRRILHF